LCGPPAPDRLSFTGRVSCAYEGAPPGLASGQRSRSGILHFREQRANPAFRRTIALHQELHCKFLKELVEGWLVAALIAQDFLLGQFLARQ
jgi:hypothetical protein